MTDPSTAIGILSSLLGLAKSINDTVTDSKTLAATIELQEKIRELNSAILQMQDDHQSLLDEKNSIKEELSNRINWDKTASKCKTHQICSGVTVIIENDDTSSEKDPVYFCPNCFSNQKLSFLNKIKKDYKGTHYACVNSICAQVFTDHDCKVPFKGASYG
ncbi:hypothetical protein IOQ59_11460 [Pontibacterium sp. N1Y112]|uniref:Uncharacterized protein n=1 Tax=Pontibacterium sinense TaxID=2781979 RepID=A0A8J7FV31_9GAMM|nr:hypothetical protein [Pontibacterium sinense]MBE9397875.1 hypothetical protein [Pontibacterium sinense]